ncbi:DUF2806 domain-containing protein [Cochlodiniinecator piscidefendens]|uniref:DUF2806 domain-containing protein n=1 Tax=Cochlodiniinecator piscidefendens TaxID=2715756 RepID=UPI001409C554|nr:DUF2806 domain-containing protein [Cochlodiniinecator piscidefendens]
MTNSENSNSENWLSTIIEGGLPQLLAGPAGKAISRLVGAFAEIPAAKLEGVAQGIRDKTDARSQLSQAIAKHVSERAVHDPEVMARATHNMLDRAYRVQKNKDAIAAIAIEELNDNPPNPESEGPSDDWLSKFERYAEDTSRDDLRTMFGKILASEIRKPGAISPVTLHFVSMLDSETAELIERVLPFCLYGGAVLSECVKPALSEAEKSYIEQSGFWTADKSYQFDLNDKGRYLRIAASLEFGFVVVGQAATNVRFKAAVLSKAGRDLVDVVGRPFDFQGFANVALAKPEISNVFYGRVVLDGEFFSIPDLHELFKTD